MESNHQETTYEFLSHVPSDSILKTWGAALFQFKVGLVFLVSQDGRNDAQIYYGDHQSEVNNHHERRFSHTILTKINHPLVKIAEDRPIIISSCNGLICISIPEPQSHGRSDHVYICNPATGEYFILPKLSLVENGQIGSGFGYLPKTKDYKAVRIHYPVKSKPTPDPITYGRVQVYTIGTGRGLGDAVADAGGWRTIGEITHSLHSPGVTVNGVIYFMDNLNRKLVAFDLEDEEFRLPEQPPCLRSAGKKSFYEVKALGGYLYVVHHERNKHVDLWSFKNKDNESTINDDDKNEKDIDHSLNWSKEFSIPWQGPGKNIFCRPITLTKSNQVLFWRNGVDLCCSDPKLERKRNCK
ncbi:hypothetical protein MKX01_031601 [Papaver californicum]|nr:hypothetical protein MKX01_031601 [Papaver californicum]